MDIKPITTIYNGYKFRSRLEARWAVFFDAAGIAYEYEKEGFILSDGSQYLPDFWIAEWKVWVEVKPPVHSISKEEMKKPMRFSKEVGNLLTVAGDPWHTTTMLLVRKDLGDFTEVAFGFEAVGNKPILVPIFTGGMSNELASHFRMCLGMDLCDAFEKARGARFEHGEKG